MWIPEGYQREPQTYLIIYQQQQKKILPRNEHITNQPLVEVKTKYKFRRFEFGIAGIQFKFSLFKNKKNCFD